MENLIELADGAAVFDGDDHHRTGTGTGTAGRGHGLALEAPGQETFVSEATPSQDAQDEPEELELNSRKQTEEGDQVSSPKFVISPMAEPEDRVVDYRAAQMHQQVMSGSEMVDSDFSDVGHDEEYMDNIVDEMMDEHPDLHKLQTVDSTNL